MRTTIDSAGRVVIPKALRDQVGLVTGEVEISRDGSGLHLEPVARDDLVWEGRWLVIPPSDAHLDDTVVQALIDADRH